MQQKVLEIYHKFNELECIAIGGPTMFDATGLYWIANFYIPLIGSII